METATIEAKRDALKTAQKVLKKELEYTRNEPCAPWRFRDEDWVDKEGGIKSAIHDLTSQIISLEHELVDPIQDAEMRAEMYAEMAITGVRDDVSLYFHTPEEEERFQERIREEVEYGYYDPEDGWVDGINSYDDRPGNCYCGVTIWSDDSYNVHGYFMCETCSFDAHGFLCFVAEYTNGIVILNGRFEDEPVLRSYSELQEMEQEERRYNKYYFMCFVAEVTYDVVLDAGRGGREEVFGSSIRGNDE